MLAAANDLSQKRLGKGKKNGDLAPTSFDLEVVLLCPLCLYEIYNYLSVLSVCAAIWKVIRSWLTAEQRNKTILVNRQDLVKYVSVDQLEPHMVAN